MADLDRGDRGAVELAREALVTSRAMDLGTATDRDLCRDIGRLAYSVESLLLVIDKLTGR